MLFTQSRTRKHGQQNKKVAIEGVALFSNSSYVVTLFICLQSVRFQQ